MKEKCPTCRVTLALPREERVFRLAGEIWRELENLKGKMKEFSHDCDPSTNWEDWRTMTYET